MLHLFVSLVSISLDFCAAQASLYGSLFLSLLIMIVFTMFSVQEVRGRHHHGQEDCLPGPHLLPQPPPLCPLKPSQTKLKANVDMGRCAR